ncbi:hypothetical protein [Virgisporangium ochraceum]|uniref:hypothetical protein n=1 Tax=Virgisporangium ochraceum TaxID=65505 RepID=UPI001944FD35|nr:hypothetical protein [Virgisporangium ochraceum]
MTRRYWVAGAAALVVQVVVTAVLVTNAERRPRDEEPPGQLVSGTPVLSEYGVRAPQRFARVVLVDRASYAEAAAPFTGAGFSQRIEGLAGTSNTGHILFHQTVGCDTVSGPQLRVDAVGTYVLTFATRGHRGECVAPQQVVVAFVHP